MRLLSCPGCRRRVATRSSFLPLFVLLHLVLIGVASTILSSEANGCPLNRDTCTKMLSGADKYNPKSFTITNNERWLDDNGDEIKANRCGTISRHKIHGYWYMVGSEASTNWRKGGDVYLYKSATLGSNSWQKVKKVFDTSRQKNKTTSNCGLHQRKDDPNTFVIHCRCRVFISHNGVDGTYKDMGTLNIPSSVQDLGPMNIGNASPFLDDNGTMYFVVTRHQKIEPPRQRYMFLYKLNQAWTGLDDNGSTGSLTAKWHWQGYEAPYISKTNGWYYLFVSQTRGWKQSRTFYRRAKSLQALATAPDQEVAMHPANTATIQSMKTQFCFLQEFEQGRWMFGGTRHPVEAPDLFDAECGRNVMVPATMVDGKPHVHWKYSFDWTKYNYNKPTHDSYKDFGTCPHTPAFREQALWDQKES